MVPRSLSFIVPLVLAVIMNQSKWDTLHDISEREMTESHRAETMYRRKLFNFMVIREENLVISTIFTNLAFATYLRTHNQLSKIVSYGMIFSSLYYMIWKGKERDSRVKEAKKFMMKWNEVGRVCDEIYHGQRPVEDVDALEKLMIKLARDE